MLKSINVYPIELTGAVVTCKFHSNTEMAGNTSTPTIQDFASVLAKDPQAVANWKNILRGLKIEFVSVILERKFNLGAATNYELFLEIFEVWKSQKPKEANINTLKEILKAEKMEDAIKNLDLLLAPKVLDGIQVEKLLGNGCYGFVFQVNYGPPKGHRAHKLFLANWREHSDSPELDEENINFREREGKMLTADHPNLVKIYKIDIIRPWIPNFSMEAGNVLQEYVNASSVKIDPFEGYAQVVEKGFKDFSSKGFTSKRFPTIRIEMELCGRSLKQWLQTAQLIKADVDTNYSKRIDIAKGIIAGLKYLQVDMDVEFIHRDLKPDNILFKGDGYQLPIKIIDFGLARPVHGDASVSMTTERGSKLYRAPEVDNGKYSKRADLYSLGLILFEMFYFIGEDERASCFKDVEGSIAKMQDVAQVPRLKDTIVGLTKKDTTERIQSVEDICLF